MADRIASQPGPSTPPSTVDARTIVNESEGDRTRDVLALERSVMAGGSPYHIGTDGEAGTLEKRMTVDFGDGPEEVIMVEWLPDDPEVRPTAVFACQSMLTRRSTVPVQLVKVSQGRHRLLHMLFRGHHMLQRYQCGRDCHLGHPMVPH